MYGQGNYAIQNGQSTNTSAAPFQQQPPGPPPLFQRAPQVPRPPVMQWGPPSAGPQVGQPGPHTYHHAHPGVPHPYPPFGVPTSGINSSQSYSMRPPPPSQIHGSTSMLQSHQTPQQHSYWNSGMNHILPVLAPGAPRVLPPPPYSGATHQQSTGSMEVLPPPPPKAQNYGDSIPAPFIPSIHSRSQDSPVPPVVTLPPPPPAASPPGDPPLPPSSPPPSSSTANAKILSSRPAQAYSTKVRHSRWDLSIDKSSEADVLTFKPVENFLAPNDVGKSEGVFKNDEGTFYSEGSPVMENLVSDLTSPPPKPVDEETEHKIVTLCQSIAKSGPEVENVIRQKESGNLEFNFLIGGEPGSEAAVAHNYFVWMKRKFQLACKSQEAQGNNQSSLIFPAAYSSHQHAHSVNTPPSHSPVDSDMEMEDDITQLDEDQHICSFVAEKQFKDNTVKDTLSCSGPLLPAELGRGSIESSYHAMSSSQEPSAKADILKRDAECVMGGSVQKSSTLEIRLDHPIASATSKRVGSEKLHSQLSDGASPFRLIQGYVSDDSLGNDDEIRLENVSPLSVSPSNELVTIAETDTGKSPKSSAKHLRVVGEDDEASSAEKYSDENRKFVKNITAPEGPNREYAPKDDVDNGEKFDLQRKDAKDKSPTLEVDEFGRLVRERESDSESDYSPGYKRRIGKRRRSRSRSRSPYDRRRRRSPWRRKENRGRSRSISPKRHRSRSRSPSRNKLTFGGDKSKRERGHVAQCFNFLRGKCYRGASCRYYHAEPEKNSRSGSYRSEHQHQDLPPISKDSDIHEEIETTTLKTVHKHDEAKSWEVKLHQDIPNMMTKDMQESEPTFQLHGKGSQVEHSASDIIDEVQKLQGDASGGMSASIGTMEINLSQGHVSGQMYQNADEKPKEKGDSSTVQALSALLPVQIPQFPTPKECQSNVVQAAHLSASFPPQLSSTSCAQQMTRDCNLMPQFNPAYIESIPPYQAPFSFQQSPFPAPSSSTWNCLPPPPPPPPRPNLPVVNESAGNAVHGQHGVPSLHFLPNRAVTRSDFTFQTSVRPYTSLLPNISQTGQCQAYVQSQPIFSRGSPSKRAPTFPGEPLPLGELPGLSSRRHPYMQQPLHGPHYPETAGGSRHLGEAGVSSSMSRYTSDIVDQNQPSCLPDFGGSSISNHFNPYSSTFSQPLPTKFSSDPLAHGENILPENNDGASFSLSNGRPATSLGSRIPTPPESSPVAQAVFPRPGSDQYDPLYDSIEPSTNSFQKSDPGQNPKATNDSGIMLRLSGSNNSLDMEENKQQKGGGTVALSDSVENDEYGETAEAEVGAVENGSASESSDAADVATGDIEIDQVKRSGKKKKSKDSRSMKLFKIAVAGFVKELLKPSWRQGNMSKEVFKTIVKKTVDKVSGAMKSHHIPKSKPKIDHYIDSSQRKLTKLVMGYVDKYVKV